MPEETTLDDLADLEEDCAEAEQTWLSLKEQTKAAKEGLDTAIEQLRRAIRYWKESRDKIKLPFREEEPEDTADREDRIAEANGPAVPSSVSFSGADIDTIGKIGKEIRRRAKKPKPV